MPDELHLTPTNILGFANKYSFYPQDQAADYRSAVVGTPQAGPGKSSETLLDGTYQGFRHTLVSDNQKVARIEVKRRVHSARGADFEVKPMIAGLTGTPSYFLPWDARGAAVEMTIPRFVLGDDATANPGIFFTAALSGCSILFKGTPDKPTIFHCGTAGGGSGTSTVGDSNDFFRKMLRDIRGRGLGRSNHKVGTQVLSSDYMTTNAGGGVAPAHESAFKNQLQAHYDQTLTIENVNIWGAIFGFRNGTQWEFYLQENATITYYNYEEVVNGLLKIVTRARAREIDFSNLSSIQLRNSGAKAHIRARPAVVRQVFPNGPALATVKSTWQTLRVA